MAATARRHTGGLFVRGETDVSIAYSHFVRLSHAVTRALSADAQAPGVVFHLDSETSMNRMLAQVARHYAFNPDIETRVILIGNGVKPARGCRRRQWRAVQCANGAVDGVGHPYFACEATLNYYNLTEDDLAFGVETVPSGVAALGRLQAREGWGYIKL